jgi:acyl carrier protein
MTRQDAVRLLGQMLEVGTEALTDDRPLRDMDGWDSLATMTFIALVDKELGRPLPGSRVARCQTVGDLLALLDPTAYDRAA